MRSTSTGVGLSFLPVTTFMSSTLLPCSIAFGSNADQQSSETAWDPHR